MLNVERYITVFNQEGHYLYEVNIDSIDLTILQRIFLLYKDDPDFIMLYQIDKKQAQQLSQLIDFEFDFDSFQYELSTYEKKL